MVKAILSTSNSRMQTGSYFSIFSSLLVTIRLVFFIHTNSRIAADSSSFDIQVMGSFPVWIGSTSSSKKCCDESVKAPFLRDRLIHCNDMNAKNYTILNIPRSRSWTITKNDLGSLENIACGLRDKLALEFARPMNVVYYYNIICTLKRSSIARTPILCQTCMVRHRHNPIYNH